FIIWKTILTIGKGGHHVLFVTGETKPDWVHVRQSDNTQLFPRYELIDEFRRETNGKTFHLVSLSRFLDLFATNKAGIDAIRQEEKLLVIKIDPSADPYFFHYHVQKALHDSGFIVSTDMEGNDY